METKRPKTAAGAAVDVLAALKATRPRKYRNMPVTVDGIIFDSGKEAERYGVLLAKQRAGEIRSLEVHPRFPIMIHGIDCGLYEGDFCYVTADGVPVLEDVKSPSTKAMRLYQMKRKQVWALYGLEIREV